MNPETARAYAAFDAQLKKAIRAGKREVQQDDASDDGRITVDPDGKPNAWQNAIGRYMPSRAAMGILLATDRRARSRAPRRKGGMQAVWLVTDPIGVGWAEE